jgi:hypothetical protein
MGIMTVNGKPINIGGGVLSVAPPDPEIYVTPTEILNVSYLGATCPVNVCGNINNSVTVADACDWLVTTTPVIPSASPGTVNNIQICENISPSCRSGVVCYTPSLGGTMKCVTICQSTGSTDITLCSQLYTSVAGDGQTLIERVCGLESNSTTVSTACSWIHATTPVSPCASPGRLHYICVDANTVCACRCGTICYTPTAGTMKTVTICQNECINWKCVDFCVYGCYGTEGGVSDAKYVCMIYNPAIANGDCYCLQLYPELDASGSFGCAVLRIACNYTQIYCCCVVNNSEYNMVSFGVDYNDVVQICLCALDPDYSYLNYAALSYIYVAQCTGSAAQFCLGSTCTSVCAWTTY